MALRYRHDPPSFSLDSHLYKRVMDSDFNGDTELYICNYAILFTSDKKRKISKIGDFGSVSFSDFTTSFNAFLMSSTTADLDSARKIFDRHSRKDVYSRPGVYTKHGRYLRPATHGDLMLFIGTGDLPVPSPKNSQGSFPKPLGDARSGNTGVGPGGGSTGAAPGGSSSYQGRAGGSNSNANGENKRDAHGKTQDASKPTSEQAAQIQDEAKILSGVKRNRDLIGRFNLSDLQRIKGVRETHVEVSRGDYAQVRTKIVYGKPGGFVITGPTGCGKSTVALLGIFSNPNTRVLMVEPTQPNAANIFHEFKNILPTLVSRGVISGVVPKVGFIAPTVSKPPFPQLSVTTTDKLLEYFYAKGKFPSFDLMVVDEFHLPISSMVEVVEFLRTFVLVPKYVLVSATAVGFKVNVDLPKPVTHIYGNLPVGKFPSKLERSDLDPRRWFSQGDGTVAVVVPSISMAKELFAVYRDWYLRGYLITRETTVTSYMRACTSTTSKTFFILEPGVEAGVTLSMSVLISMGATTAIRYDGRVVVEDTQPLDTIAGIQRGSRGGRVKPTLYVSPLLSDDAAPVNSSDYLRAQALIKAVAMGADIKKIELGELSDQFPKLATLSKALCTKAVSGGGDPFIAVYKTSPSGSFYTECGGSGRGFADLAKKELFLYHHPKGFFIAPIADFSDLRSQPDTFVVRDSQITAARAMVDAIPGLLDKYDLDRLVGLVVSKFGQYRDDFFDRLTGVFDQKSPVGFVRGSKPAEVEDFISEAPAMIKLFAYLKTQPEGVKYKRVVTPEGTAKHSFECGKRVMHFAFAEKYMQGTSVNVKKLSSDVFELLTGLLAVEVLLDGAPKKCVNLIDYRHRVPSGHEWFSRVVGRS